METSRTAWILAFSIAAVSSACSKKWEYGAPLPTRGPILGPSDDGSRTHPALAQLTILGTNDIHGGIEPSETQAGDKMGGLAFYAGVVSAIRKGVQARAGDHGGVLVVDAGDQFQGTLLSNFDEGKLIFSSMNEIGYDAA